ncbi:hypothetical protein Glove_229g126 [Diversispora epigaea]|uniref:F-box domain-containing protein n=1 Tax=Diversispora epigaea TaxID=1348612 RepID=A0A397IFX1_9GLOM|nr:hypothetical protein Glove_229g126 [Diversispora epigaea]
MSQVLIQRLICFERVMRKKIKPLYCSKMAYLRLEGLKISDVFISAILHSCPNIRFLILDKSKGFTNIPIIEIARYCPKLLHLSLNSYICLTNRCITEITRSCPKLRHLELGQCSIGNETVKEIARNCTNLKYLGLEGCEGISKEVMKKLNLKIKIEHPDYSDDKFSDSDLPPLIPDPLRATQRIIFTGRPNKLVSTRSFRDYYLSYTSDGTDLISAISNYLRENPPTWQENPLPTQGNLSIKEKLLKNCFITGLNPKNQLVAEAYEKYLSLEGLVKLLTINEIRAKRDLPPPYHL